MPTSADREVGVGYQFLDDVDDFSERRRLAGRNVVYVVAVLRFVEHLADALHAVVDVNMIDAEVPTARQVQLLSGDRRVY